MNQLLSANPKLQIVDQLFDLLDRHPHLWAEVSRLARSKEFFLSEAFADRMAMALAIIERAMGETSDVVALKTAVASLAQTD